MNYLKYLPYVAVLLVGIYVWYLRGENSDLVKENVTLSIQLQVKEDAITQLKKDAEDRLKRAQEDLDKAKAEADALRKTANDLYKAKPNHPDDLCRSALELVNQ